MRFGQQFSDIFYIVKLVLLYQVKALNTKGLNDYRDELFKSHFNEEKGNLLQKFPAFLALFKIGFT